MIGGQWWHFWCDLLPVAIVEVVSLSLPNVPLTFDIQA